MYGFMQLLSPNRVFYTTQAQVGLQKMDTPPTQ